MARWFWIFVLYSFLGFLLEVIFAHVIHHPKRDRKCLYFLPLCPVYGLGALAILLLPAELHTHPLLLFFCAALSATATEFLVGLFYEKIAHVCFWSYAQFPCNIGGKICPVFALCWGLLGLGLTYGLHPAMQPLLDAIPVALTLPAVLFLALDSGASLILLRRTRTTEVLRWYLPARRSTSAGTP